MITRISLYDGKYTVVHENGTNLKALRYGEPWRDLSGDGLILAMAQRITELEEAHQQQAQALDDVIRQMRDTIRQKMPAFVAAVDAIRIPKPIESGVPTFDYETLDSIATGLDCYQETFKFGDGFIESSPAAAARFIRGFLQLPFAVTEVPK